VKHKQTDLSNAWKQVDDLKHEVQKGKMELRMARQELENERKMRE